MGSTERLVWTEAGLSPVVVVGSGPVGHRAVREILRVDAQASVVWYGDETWAPYNRVKLSSFVAGEVDWTALADETDSLPALRLERRFGCRITAIDTVRQEVLDAQGGRQAYSSLVLATGSRPHVPDIPGLSLAGVYTFRNLNDAQRLMARTVRSRTTVVIGGGLLGLEAAKAIRRFNTHVIVVEHASRLMPRQLDVAASQTLAEQVRALGIEIFVAEGVKLVQGDARVTGVVLRSGLHIACDTVIVAAGILPNTELACEAGIAVGRGIRVDDQMRTTTPLVYAVGECAEHRDIVHGLVAPGFEQAAVLAHALAGREANYEGTVSATNLKVLGCKVFSVGDFERSGPADIAQEIRFSDPSRGIYRKVLLRHGRLAGAVAVGEWSEVSRVQEAVRVMRQVWPWQRWRFVREGCLWPESEGEDVSLWPDDATVCNCTGVNKGRLCAAMRQGCNSVDTLCAATSAGTVCGSCRPLLVELLGATNLPAILRHKALFVLACISAVCAIAYTLAHIPLPDTSEMRWRWDAIWREGWIKQLSGYSVLGMMAALAVLSLRKRVERVRFGGFDLWRLIHVALGVGVLLILFAHTGGRFGERADYVMSMATAGALLSGAAIALVLSRQHVLEPRFVKRSQSLALWVHVLSLWLLPALLVYHVLRVYFF